MLFLGNIILKHNTSFQNPLTVLVSEQTWFRINIYFWLDKAAYLMGGSRKYRADSKCKTLNFHMINLGLGPGSGQWIGLVNRNTLANVRNRAGLKVNKHVVSEASTEFLCWSGSWSFPNLNQVQWKLYQKPLRNALNSPNIVKKKHNQNYISQKKLLLGFLRGRVTLKMFK